MPPAKPATLKRIAELAKVSPSVVSAVLSGHSGTIRCSEKTAERIRNTAKRVHYRPSRIARNLQSSEHLAIGLLVSQLYLLPQMYLHWLSVALGARNRLLIIQSLADPHDVASCQMLQQRFVDAAVCAEDLGPEILARCGDISLPMLFINTDPQHPGSRILFDEAQGMTDLVTHLKDQGYTDLIFFDHEGEGYWVEERRQVCRAAARSQGFPPPRLISASGQGATSKANDADRIAAACSVRGAVITHDPGIIPFLQRRLNARALCIPEDVGVVSLGKAAPDDMTWTCAYVETRLLADQSADLLLDANGLASNTRVRVPYLIEVGDSSQRRRI